MPIYARNIAPLATAGRAATLTYKQADVMTCLCEGPVTTREIADTLAEVMREDIMDGQPPMYLSTTRESIQSCLVTLEARGLVTRTVQEFGVLAWKLTPKGEKAAKAAEL